MLIFLYVGTALRDPSFTSDFCWHT